MTLKNALRRSEGGSRIRLLTFLFKYRVTQHVTTGRPPYKMLSGRHDSSLLDLATRVKDTVYPLH